MGFFDDEEDPFDAIFNEFFGAISHRKTRKQEDMIVDFFEADGKIYLVLEFPGYEDDGIMVSVDNNRLKITAKARDSDNAKDYLSQKLSAGIHYERILPAVVNAKSMKHLFANGILEISFEKSG